MIIQMVHGFAVELVTVALGATKNDELSHLMYMHPLLLAISSWVGFTTIWMGLVVPQPVDVGLNSETVLVYATTQIAEMTRNAFNWHIFGLTKLFAALDKNH